MNAPQQPPSLLSLDNIIFMLFRRKWLILLGVLLGTGAAGYVYFTAPITYVSQAKLLVRYVTDNTSMDPSAEEGKVMRPDSRGGNILNSEAAILQSRNLAAAVVREIGASVIFPPKEGEPLPSENLAAANLLKSLEIAIPRNSSIIELAYHGPSPEVSQQVLDRLINHYLEKHQAIHSAASSYGFFSQKTDQLRSELRATEAELQELKHTSGVVDVEESRTMLVNRLDLIRQRLDEQQGMIAGAEARTTLLQEQLGTTPVATNEAAAAGEPAVDPAEEMKREQAFRQLVQLRQREFELLATYTPDSAPLQSIRLQIVRAESLAGVQSRPTASGVTIMAGSNSAEELHKELILERSRMVSAQALIKLLIEQKEAAEQEIQLLNQNESRIVELQRQQEIQDAAYRRFADALDVAKNQLALAPDQLSNIFEVEPATLPLRPVKPEELKNTAAMAGAVGLGIGCGLALLLEFLGMQQFRRSDDIERELEVPTLMTLPRGGVFKKPFVLNGGGKMLKASKQDPDADPPQTDRTLAEPVQSHYEALLHRVELTGVFDGLTPHLVGVTSCGVGSGTTTIASGLALTMSRQEEAKVLLIDGDFGKGDAHRLLGVDDATSFPTLLVEGSGASARVQKGLYLLSAGNGEHRLARPSLGRRFRDLVTQLKEGKYTTVVLDMPPVEETSPTLQMAGLLDGVILVVESEKISRDRARSVLKMLKDNNANVIGVVFNKKQDYVPAWLDGKG